MSDQSAPLSGLRILVVEDEFVIALSTETALRDLGCTDVVVALHLPDAVEIAKQQQLDAALLDVNLAGSEVFPVADVLVRRGIPFIFLTGYGPEVIRADLRHHYLVRKPFQPRDIKGALEHLHVPVAHSAT